MHRLLEMIRTYDLDLVSATKKFFKLLKNKNRKKVNHNNQLRKNKIKRNSKNRHRANINSILSNSKKPLKNIFVKYFNKFYDSLL